MNLLEKYSYFSGYKINVSKTQILTLNYTPSKEIQESFHFNWNIKKIKYLGVTITKGLSKLYKANYNKISEEIQKDTERWSTLPLDLNSRIENQNECAAKTSLFIPVLTNRGPPNAICDMGQDKIKVYLGR